MGARGRGSAGVQGHRIGLGARGQAGVSPRFHLATSPTSSSSSPTAAAATPPGASLHLLAWWHLQDVT